MAEQNQPYLGHRDACDECHQRKVRCTAEGGACSSCVSLGKTCVYSPKVPVGRPKKRRAAQSQSQSSGGAKAESKPIRPSTVHAAQSCPSGGSMSARPDAPSCSRPAFHSSSSSTASMSRFDGTTVGWSTEPELVNSSSSSVASMPLAPPFHMQAPMGYMLDFMHIDTDDPETNGLFITGYEDNYMAVGDNDFSSMLTSESMMDLSPPTTKIKNHLLPMQAPHFDATTFVDHDMHETISLDVSQPQTIPRQQSSEPTSRAPSRLGSMSKNQGQTVSKSSTSIPPSSSTTFASLLNTVFDLRGQKDNLMAFLNTNNLQDSQIPAAEFETSFASISSHCDLIEEYINSIEQQCSETNGSSSPPPAAAAPFQLVVAISVYVLEIFHLVIKNPSVFLSASPQDLSAKSPNRGATWATQNDIPQRLHLILRLTTIEYHARRWRRSFSRIAQLLGDGADERAELLDARTKAVALQNDLVARMELLRSSGHT